MMKHVLIHLIILSPGVFKEMWQFVFLKVKEIETKALECTVVLVIGKYTTTYVFMW